VKKGAIAAHPAIRAQGLGDFRRNRVHQEKLKQKADADDKGQHRLVDHFYAKWTCVRVSSFPQAEQLSTACLWICGWLNRYRSYRSGRRWVRGIRLGGLWSVGCIS